MASQTQIVERICWAIGAKVKIGEHHSRDAWVSQIMIRAEGIGYEVYWWEGTARHELIVLDRELPDPEGEHTIKVKMVSN